MLFIGIAETLNMSCPYADHTDYTPYTRYIADPDDPTENEIPAQLIRTGFKRTRPIMQAKRMIP